MVQLYGDERIDYVLANETMPIIQSPTVFSFSLDALLLASFTYVPIQRGQLLDLCTGNGVIPLLLSRRTKGQITGLEIQSKLVKMAQKSVKINQLEEPIKIIEGDLREKHPRLQQSSFDVVTCNPPYFSTPNETEHNKSDYLTIARHEVCCTLEDVIKACKLYVRPGGKVSLVHRPNRLVDLVTLLRNYQLEPKRLRYVYAKKMDEANIILIEATRDGKPGLITLPPLVIYENDGTYTAEARNIIYGK